MRIELRGSPAQAAMIWFEQSNESVRTMRSSIIAASPSVVTSLEEISFKRIASNLRTQTSRYFTSTGPAENFIFVAPPQGGYIHLIDVADQVNVMQRSLLFYESTLDIIYMRMGFGAVVSSANATKAVITAPGKIGLSNNGLIEQITLENDELQVDLLHLIAWDRSIEMQARLTGGNSVLLQMMSGISPFVTLSGSGRVWVSSASGR